MSNGAVVSAYCRISNNTVEVNGRKVFEKKDLPFDAFADEAFRHLNVQYPKFHKMDRLSKLGFLTAEYLLNGSKLNEKHKPENTGVIISNKSSSLDTDLKHHALAEKGAASPAVFVYTLPNILIGEICIRHGIKGENAFFVSDRYNIPFLVNYVNSLFDSGVIDACISGWVELIGEVYESFVYLVERDKKPNLKEHSVTNIQNIYN